MSLLRYLPERIKTLPEPLRDSFLAYKESRGRLTPHDYRDIIPIDVLRDRAPVELSDKPYPAQRGQRIILQHFAIALINNHPHRDIALFALQVMRREEISQHVLDIRGCGIYQDLFASLYLVIEYQA